MPATYTIKENNMSIANVDLIARIVTDISDDYLASKLVDMSNGEVISEDLQSAFLAEAAARLGRNVYPSDEQLKSRDISKGELADNLYPEADGYKVDCAIPQGWVGYVTERISDEERRAIISGMAFHFVTVYKVDWAFGRVMPITRTGIDILAKTWE